MKFISYVCILPIHSILVLLVAEFMMPHNRQIDDKMALMGLYHTSILVTFNNPFHMF